MQEIQQTNSVNGYITVYNVYNPVNLIKQHMLLYQLILALSRIPQIANFVEPQQGTLQHILVLRWLLRTLYMHFCTVWSSYTLNLLEIKWIDMYANVLASSRPELCMYYYVFDWFNSLSVLWLTSQVFLLLVTLFS